MRTNITTNNSIRLKIRNLAFISVLLALGVTFTFNTIYTIYTDRKAAILELNVLAEIVARNSQSALMFKDKSASAETLNALSPRADIISAEIITTQNEILAQRNFQQDPTNIISSLLSAGLGINNVVHIEKTSSLNGAVLGKIKLTVDTSMIWQAIFKSLSAYIGAMFLTIIFSAFLIRRMIARIILPITRLSQSASEIAKTRQYTQRVEKLSNDELGNMTDQFNLMLSEVEKRDHELLQKNNLLETEVQRRTKTIKSAMEEMHSLLNSMAEGAFGVDNEGRCTFVNASFLRILGYDETDNLITQNIENIIHHTQDGEASTYTQSELYKVLHSRQGGHASDEVFWRKDGVAIPVEYWSQPIIVDDIIQGTITTFIDITDRKKSELELKISATAFETQDAMMVTDANTVILRVNKAFTETAGYTLEEVIGQLPKILRSGLQDEHFYAMMWQNINTYGTWRGEVWNKRKNGEIYPARLVITAVKDAHNIVTNYVALITDITTSKAAEAEIENLAFYDPLTGLPNRRLLLDRLQQALVSSARNNRDGALLFLDLDHFKTLNDTLGHHVGDMLLKEVAVRLSRCVRESDTVARLGGDEFIVLLQDLNENNSSATEQAESIGKKILNSINQPYELLTHEYQASSSIGIALFRSHDWSSEDLLKHADIAMYQAKKAGRNTLRFFAPEMQTIIDSRATLEKELKKALRLEQFELHYQIQLSSSNQVLGAEALIRWMHPKRGIISPSQFIPLAEESHLIIEIGNWVINQACAQLKLWQQNPSTQNLTLAINVSAKQLKQADFVETLKETISRHDIDPNKLKIELTESILLDNIENIIAPLNALKELGIKFILDDFGTGYSSLQYLKKLPLDQLKIDQSFVRDIATDNSDKAIVLTIISMAQSLNLNVIAEGVETDEQHQLLMDNGCMNYQGFLFGKPIAIEEFEALLN